MNQIVHRHRTAISRGGDLSRPVQTAFHADLLPQDCSFFDYGCGRGEDIRLLTDMGYNATGWDPTYRKDSNKISASVVNLGYVINVIEDPNERIQTAQNAWELANDLLIVSARLKFDSKPTVRSDEYRDGCLTSSNTFQKFYTQNELKDWITDVLEEQAIAAAPGIFFVFKNNAMRQGYLAKRYKRRRLAPRITKSEKLYQEHQELLSSLIHFITDHGRLPKDWECPEYEEITSVFGSVKKAFAVIRRVTGREQWDSIRHERMDEILIQFALDRFSGRARFSDLPPSTQIDVREFFSSYKQLCQQADILLFQAGDMELVAQSIAQSNVGKRTGNALYVHHDALYDLPVLLRVYEGCARAYIGDLVEANVLKLHRDTPRVSYLTYPMFDECPHPILKESFLVKMGALSISYRNYEKSNNPPLLHRKEEFISKDDIRWEGFRKLTQQEEKWGLYEWPESIGTVNGWNEVLEEMGACFKGKRLIRRKSGSIKD